MSAADHATDPILRLYETSDEQNRLRHDLGPLEEARMRELLARFLPAPGSVVCDVGGAAGAYSFWMAARGYRVSLVDVVPLHIDQARARQDGLASGGLESMVVADARRLPYSDASFDCLLMHGPLYHLTAAADRRAALAEAWRVLRPAGTLIAVGITRYASLLFALSAGGIWRVDYLRMLVEGTGSGLHRGGFGFGGDRAVDVYFHLPSELVQEIGESGFQPTECLGVVGPGWMAKDFEESWRDEERRETLLSIARLTEREPVLGPRTMVVARKAPGSAVAATDGGAHDGAR
jgi:SAM-dependent methyltransferase